MHKNKDNYLPPKVIWVFKNAQLKPPEDELKFNRILQVLFLQFFIIMYM